MSTLKPALNSRGKSSTAPLEAAVIDNLHNQVLPGAAWIQSIAADVR
jgi:hypothetical protein